MVGFAAPDDRQLIFTPDIHGVRGLRWINVPNDVCDIEEVGDRELSSVPYRYVRLHFKQNAPLSIVKNIFEDMGSTGESPSPAIHADAASEASSFPMSSGWDRWNDAEFYVSGDSLLTAEGQIQVNLHVWSMNQVFGFTGGALTNVYDSTGTIIRKFLVTCGVDFLHSNNNDRRVEAALPDEGGDPHLIELNPARIDHLLGNFPQNRIDQLVQEGAKIAKILHPA